jgi:hypothetical protein
VNSLSHTAAQSYERCAATREAEIVGTIGIALGSSVDDDTGGALCAVQVADVDLSVMISTRQLKATGGPADPSDVYDGTYHGDQRRAGPRSG